MKKTTILFIFSLLLISCGEKQKEISTKEAISTNNLKTIKEKKVAIEQQQQKLSENLKLLNEKIAELDTLKKHTLVTTLNVQEQVFNHYLELQGNVQTKENLVLYPEFSGTLTNIFVKKGQKVYKGQVLAKIDDAGLSQQLTQVEIGANLAKTTFERQEKLWKQKIGSEIQYLQAKSNYQAQSKAVAQLKSQLAKTTIKAPFSGTIDDVITEKGSVVATGQSPIIRIINLQNMYVESDVPEAHLKNITKNKKVIVDIPVLNQKINAKINQVGNYIKPDNRTFKIEILIPNKNKAIKPNLNVKIKVNDYTNANAFLIPQSIISENAKGEQYIYVITKITSENEGVAIRKFIKTGKTQGDLIEVIQGISSKDKIIKEGARSIREGQTIKIINS